MAKKSTGFPAVGDSVLAYVGSGVASRPLRGQLEAKATAGRGSSPTGTKANRGGTMIKEACGPKCSVVATLYHANAAEASAVERNVKIMPPAGTAVNDFWRARAATRQV